MPLNYSKWDNLELSDDSDIEGHPNVDKKSLIRWKQRDIHEKREERKLHIAQLKADIACNNVLEPRIKQIAKDVEEKGPTHFSQLVERFKTQPSPEAPPTNAPNQKTYDEMLLSLLLGIWEDAKKQGVDKDSPRLGETLVKGLQNHAVKLAEHQAKLKTELEKEEAEQKKKITSDDLHDGFESHYVPPKPAPPPVKGAVIEPASKGKAKATQFEVINPKGVEAASNTFASTSTADIEEELPELTPSLEAFSHLPLKGYEQSWEFIKAHRDVVVPGASDALLVAAFQAQSEGKAKHARQCVHQSLLLQYCDKLGKDGVSIFFRKMISGDQRATVIFEKDVQDTYNHLVERVRISKAEEKAQPAEQIQLVPENPETKITFNVPDGPPPEKLELEGPGFEDVSMDDVRKALQMRWDVFSAFDPKLQEALKSDSLDEVNKVLGNMRVEDAEEVVKLLDMAGILNFSEGGIRDETGKGGDTDEE
ncbi:Cdc37 N terminal kinase binding-domain-containing protein [Cristinia sonorae]|uniref:Hsp90 chaperone protein kinase-targeting subunit n=1 Tax=Cristinia sonorae TaxID=1940300 RepID=A0A8K0UVU1_9AGAR|nr:Cdc37 N terminal kinase binding-domain-containing protein [Cristinia sonorae]